MRRIEGTTTSMPSRNRRARAVRGSGVQSTITCGPVFAQRAVIGDRGAVGIVVSDQVTVEPGATVGTHVPKATALATIIGALVGGTLGLGVGAVLARRR